MSEKKTPDSVAPSERPAPGGSGLWLDAMRRQHVAQLADFYARHPRKRIPADHRALLAEVA